MDKQQLISPRKINDVIVSPIALGTMRFQDKGLTKIELVDLLSFLYHEIGINIHHSSYEYNSYPMYCEALAIFKKENVDVKHICKISAPDFKEENFSAKKLRERILSELKNLKSERIDFLQWLLRSEPIDDEIRIKRLVESEEEINFTFKNLIKEGLIGQIGTFPYSVLFGEEVTKKIKNNSGWISYFNLLEQENILNLPEGQWMIGLRPLAAGKIFEYFHNLDEDLKHSIFEPTGNLKKDITNFSLSYCLMDMKVASNVLSINTYEQAKDLKKFYDSKSLPNQTQIQLTIDALKNLNK